MGFFKGIGYGILAFIGGLFLSIFMPDYFLCWLCILPLAAVGIGFIENSGPVEKHFVVLQEGPKIATVPYVLNQEKDPSKIVQQKTSASDSESHVRAFGKK